MFSYNINKLISKKAIGMDLFFVATLNFLKSTQIFNFPFFLGTMIVGDSIIGKNIICNQSFATKNVVCD
jgi:hypothetical protein